MDDTILLLLKYLSFLLVTYVALKHINLRSKFKPPPSPFPAVPFIGHLYLFKKPLHRSLASLAAKYGPILYLKIGSRRVVLVSSPSTIEESLVRNDVFVNRPRNVLHGKYSGNNFTSIGWAPFGAHWKNLRKIVAVEVLSPQRLHNLAGIRANVARSFLHRMMMLQNNSENGVIIEMKPLLFGLALDLMTKMLLGRSMYEEDGIGKEGIEHSRRFEKSFSVNSGVSTLEDFMPILKWLKVVFGTSYEKTLKMMKEEKDEIMNVFLKEHREMEKEGRLNEERKRSMLHALLCFQKQDPSYYNDEMIGSLLMSLFQGGTETSAAAIVWAFSLLLNHPKILKKAQAQIDEHVGHQRLVGESDKNNIPYIQCIVNETLRMYPTGPLGLLRESINDCEVGGYHVPKGSILVYNIWAVHNNPEIWEEPRKFKPERFMGVEGNRLGYKFMPFGIGRRTCPGENLAGRVVWLAVAILIQCFEWERVGEELVDMKENGVIFLNKLEPLNVKCRPRPCMMDLLSQL